LANKSALPVILLILFLDLVGFSIVFPMMAEILTWYGGQEGSVLRGLTEWLDGVFGVAGEAGTGRRHAAFFGGALAGLYSVVQFLVTPFWGRLSDRVGRRPVLLATVALNLAGYIVWIISARFELFVVSRLIGGLASGNISVASAAAADVSTRENRTKTLGLVGAAIGLGFITGPALGATYSLLPHPEAKDAFASLHPFTIPAAIAALLSLVNLVWVARALPETLPPERRGKTTSTRTANPLLLFRRDLGPRIPRLNVAYLLFMIGFAGFEATLVFLLADRVGYGPGAAGLCMVWIGFSSALIQGGVVRRVVKRTGERRLAVLGLIVLIPGFALCGLPADILTSPLLWTGVTLLAIGVGFFSPSITSLVSLQAGAAAQGQAMGSFRSVGALGRALGPFAAAFLYFRFGPGTPYLAAAALTAVPAWLIWRLRGGDVVGED
jgi:MFS family permease